MIIKKTLITLVLTAAALTAEMKVATVNVAAVFDGYQKTAETQKEVEVRKQEIEKKNQELLKKVQELKAKHDKLRKTLEDPSTGDKKKVELAKEYQSITQEGATAERQRQMVIEQQSRALNEHAAANAREIFKEIQDEINVIAEADGYDFIFNTAVSGQRGVPVFLYTKKSFDITEQVSKSLAAKVKAESDKDGE